MGSKVKFLLLLIAAFAAVGCSSPIGSIGGRAAGSGVYDGIKAVGKETYYLSDLFQRLSDLQVYKTYKGQRQQSTVPVNDCQISIMDNPDNPGALILVPVGSNYRFESIGTKTIVVKYNSYEDRYQVVVRERDPNDPNSPTAGGTGDEESGIIILWPDG